MSMTLTDASPRSRREMVERVRSRPGELEETLRTAEVQRDGHGRFHVSATARDLEGYEYRVTRYLGTQETRTLRVYRGEGSLSEPLAPEPVAKPPLDLYWTALS